jgi:hypothetical protein
MANNRKTTRGRKKQVVYSEPQRIFKERYITDHCLERGIREGLSRKQALDTYGKNRYITNPNAVPIKTIYHIV